MLFPLQRLVPFRFIRFLETHLDSVRLHSSMISSCHPGATHFDRSTNTTTPHISRYRGVSGYRICATSKLLRTSFEGMSKALILPIQSNFRINARCRFLEAGPGRVTNICTCLACMLTDCQCLQGMHVGRRLPT